MSWRVTVQYACTDGSTKTKSHTLDTQPSTQHWADRRGLITAPGFAWHVSAVDQILLEHVDDEAGK